MAGYVTVSNKIRKPVFVGFSTVDKVKAPYTLTDIELVKRDILNHFATPVGSRIMMPEYGSNIHNYLFDPFDDFTKNAILEDAVKVIESDPRVSLVSLNITDDDNQTINLEIVLEFQPSATVDTLYVTFSQKSKETF